MDELNMTEETPNNPSRRNFIKGVIAAGAAVSSASYLFRTQRVRPGDVRAGQRRTPDLPPSTARIAGST